MNRRHRVRKNKNREQAARKKGRLQRYSDMLSNWMYNLRLRTRREPPSHGFPEAFESLTNWQRHNCLKDVYKNGMSKAAAVEKWRGKIKT